jgi:putative aldouronate transport system permease protein
MRKRKKLNAENAIFNTFNYTFMIILAIVTLYPFVNTIAVSFNDGLDTVRGGIYLWPRIFTLENYKNVFSNGTLVGAFIISISRTIIGTALSVFCTAMLAYTLSRKEYIFNKFITPVFILTMYFNAGLIPGYFLMRSLGLLDNYLVYIIPGLVGVFNMIIIRTYIHGLPESLQESARLDGAGDFRIFISIIFPLCLPVLATVALFTAVGAWNSWFDAYIFCPNRPDLSTLQLELMRILQQTQGSSVSAATTQGVGLDANSASNVVTPMSIRAATTIVTATPILFVYPFLQKYFITGMTLGGVKE